jgi:hypothetical protein
MSASHIVANLQGHVMVLSSELNEIQADLMVLQHMEGRYAVQCGISSFDAPVMNLLRLRDQKQSLLAQVQSQLGAMEDHVASSTALVHTLNYGAPPSSTSYVHRQPQSGNSLSTVLSYPAGSSTPFISSAELPFVIPAAPGMVHVHTPGGFVVTTNSAILANSPLRHRM